MQNKEELKGNKYLVLIQETKTKVEGELSDICNKVLALLDSHLLEKASPENLVFYLKMKADYQRYLCEFKAAEAKEQMKDETRDAYRKALDEAEKLAVTHPIRLGVELNHAVFQCEVENKLEQAINGARSAFENAIQELD